MGRMKKEGWIRKVLTIFECQVETRAMIRPGNSTNAKMRPNVSSMLPPAVASNGTINSFPSRVRREAKMRRRNLQERRPPSGRILQGPVFKALAKPKLAVNMDVVYVTVNKFPSKPTSEYIWGSFGVPRSSPKRKKLERRRQV